jgi:hypothetical protein
LIYGMPVDELAGFTGVTVLVSGIATRTVFAAA